MLFRSVFIGGGVGIAPIYPQVKWLNDHGATADCIIGARTKDLLIFEKELAEVSNLYWKMDVEDNAFVILRNTENNRVASLHSTMTQWRHLFSLEVFLEKGYMVLNGLITSTMSYGKEILTIAKSRSAAPAATWQDEVRTEYMNNNSWRYEMRQFFDAINEDKPIKIGNSEDALRLMTIIDKIYAQKSF